MTISKCLALLLLLPALVATQAVATTEASENASITPKPEQLNTRTTELQDLLTYKPSDEVDTVEESDEDKDKKKEKEKEIMQKTENGGHPFGKPGDHKSGFRHVKAHDGFHNINNEEKWKNWNDKFTTATEMY